MNSEQNQGLPPLQPVDNAGDVGDIAGLERAMHTPRWTKPDESPNRRDPNPDCLSCQGRGWVLSRVLRRSRGQFAWDDAAGYFYTGSVADGVRTLITECAECANPNLRRAA